MKNIVIVFAIVLNIYAFDLKGFVGDISDSVSKGVSSVSDSVSNATGLNDKEKTAEKSSTKTQAFSTTAQVQNNAKDEELEYKKNQAALRYKEKLAEITALEKDLEAQYKTN